MYLNNKEKYMKNTNIIKISEVKERTKLSQPTIYRLMSKGKFPKQIKLSERSAGWLEQEVMDYLDKRINERL